MSDEESMSEAIAFVREHKKLFIDYTLANATTVPEGSVPVAVFMAGTPGAGKTEIAKSLMSLFDYEPVRIDADDYRSLIPGYNGANSHIVQSAASLAVEKVFDAVVHKEFSFILDATFAVGKATANIKRAIRHGYDTQIYFVYQDPVEAWNFTKHREQKEGRRVPRDAFINAYFASRKNVEKVKNEFGDQIVLRVIVKNYVTDQHKVFNEVTDLDSVLPALYTRDKLGEMLHD